MSISKYKPKVALGSSEGLIRFKSRADVEKYVKNVNPYRTRSGSAIKGVVAEVVNYVTLVAVDLGREVTSEDVDKYFRNFIPNSYQMSGEYISEIVSEYQKEQGVKSKKVSQEELTFIRERLKSKIERSPIEKLDIPKSEARKRDNSLRDSFKGAEENKDGSVTVNVWVSKERFGGYIRALYDDSKKLRIKDQFKPERLKETLKNNVGVSDELIDYLSKRGLELATINGKPLTKRMAERKIWDMTTEINKLVSQTFNSVIVGLMGEHLTVEEVDSSLRAKLDERFGEWGVGNTTRDGYARFFQQFRDRLASHTTFHMYPLVVQAILQKIDSLSDEELKNALEQIYDKKLMPNRLDKFYTPQRLSGWVSDVLDLFSVDKKVIGALQSTAFEEDGYSSLYENIAEREAHKPLTKIEVVDVGEEIWNMFKDGEE